MLCALRAVLFLLCALALRALRAGLFLLCALALDQRRKAQARSRQVAERLGRVDVRSSP